MDEPKRVRMTLKVYVGIDPKTGEPMAKAAPTGRPVAWQPEQYLLQGESHGATMEQRHLCRVVAKVYLFRMMRRHG